MWICIMKTKGLCKQRLLGKKVLNRKSSGHNLQMNQTIKVTILQPNICPPIAMKGQRKIMANFILLTIMSSLHKLSKVHPLPHITLPQTVQPVLHLPGKEGTGNQEAKEILSKSPIKIYKRKWRSVR